MNVRKRLVILSVAAVTTVGLVVGGTTNVLAATKTSNDKVTTQTKQPRALDIFSEGSLTATGTGVNGLTLENGNTATTGNLSLAYDAKAVGTSIVEDSQYVVQIPSELQPLVNTENFKQYISGTYHFISSTGNTVDRTYTQDQIHVEDNGAVIAFDNPEITHLGGASFNININLDLGTAITHSQVRIANAQGDSNYHFLSAIVPTEGTINWSLIGDYNSGTDLPTAKLDPGYDLLQVKPTIEEPVYNTDTEITGTGTPGAAIEITANDSVIGTGTVNSIGIYHVQITHQDANTIIAVTQNTGVGKSEATTTTVKERIPAPFVHYFYEGDTVISGTGSTPGNTIVVTDAAGSEITRGKLDANMGFDIPIKEQKEFDILYVYETDGTEQSLNTTVIVRPAQSF